MSVDEAAMHAAILAVNEALEKESSTETLAALRNPNTCLVKVEGDNAERYQNILIKAKRDKAAKAQVHTVQVQLLMMVVLSGACMHRLSSRDA